MLGHVPVTAGNKLNKHITDLQIGSRLVFSSDLVAVLCLSYLPWCYLILDQSANEYLHI